MRGFQRAQHSAVTLQSLHVTRLVGVGNCHRGHIRALKRRGHFFHNQVTSWLEPGRSTRVRWPKTKARAACSPSRARRRPEAPRPQGQVRVKAPAWPGAGTLWFLGDLSVSENLIRAAGSNPGVSPSTLHTGPRGAG